MSKLKKYIPASLKSKLVRLQFLNRLRARRLAVTTKRLDLCAAQFAHMLHLSPHIPIKDRTCLEIGSGWVLSHAVICHLLGAKKVIAADVTPMAKPECLKDAIRKAEPSIVRDVLSPFCGHSEIRERLNRLLSINKFTSDTLNRLGIEYLAPFDMAKDDLNSRIDFIYSFAVLEHIPVDEIAPLLKNIALSLKPGGAMLHCIHMEDHRDFNNPFDFLSMSRDSYPPDIQTIRSNRVRRSQWHTFFRETEGIEYTFIYEWSRNDRALPKDIDPSIIYEDEKDLRVSHLGVYGIKK